MRRDFKKGVSRRMKLWYNQCKQIVNRDGAEKASEEEHEQRRYARVSEE